MYSFLALSYSATSLVGIRRQWVEYELSELRTHNLNVCCCMSCLFTTANNSSIVNAH